MLLAAARSAGAQDTAALVTPGARVRVEAPALGPGRTVHRVYLQRGDTLILLPDRFGAGDTLALALADVRGLEVSRGWRRHALVGGLVGLAVGVAVGAAYGNAQYEPEPPDCFLCFQPSRDQKIMYGAMLGAYVGAPLGVLVGRFALGDSWERLVPARTRVGVVPAPSGGVLLGVRIPSH